ncbi:hypothetical protein G3I23_05010, partial [Streptomyces sp. SID10115]|nr:hypothetical protein [Streptomyces sp. SID10115]
LRRARLGRAPLLDTLELTLRTRTLDDVASAAPSAPKATPLAPVTDPLAPESAPAAVRASSGHPSSDPAPSESLPALITRARALQELGHPDADACWARLRTLVAASDYVHPDDPEVGPLVRLRADLLADEASRADERDDHAVAVPLYEEAAGLYDDAGAAGDAAIARAFALLAAA